MGIQNDFTTWNNQYPNSCPRTLHLLDKYSKISASKIPASEGFLFLQVDSIKGNGGRGGHNNRVGYDKTYDKNYWKYKEWYKCGEKVHPASHFTKTKKYKDNDNNSTIITISRECVKKLAKDFKKMSREFTTVNTQIQNLKEADSDLSDSKDEDEASCFQMADMNFDKSDFQFAQLYK